MTPLARATLTQLTSLESFPVQWNPRSYAVALSRRVVSPASIGFSPRAAGAQVGAGGVERFSARLFFDTTETSGAGRDLREVVARLEQWAAPEEESGFPPGVLFHWGTFRFRGVIEDLREEWVRFDADGTPVRAWVDLTIRR